MKHSYAILDVVSIEPLRYREFCDVNFSSRCSLVSAKQGTSLWNIELSNSGKLSTIKNTPYLSDVQSLKQPWWLLFGYLLRIVIGDAMSNGLCCLFANFAHL